MDDDHALADAIAARAVGIRFRQSIVAEAPFLAGQEIIGLVVGFGTGVGSAELPAIPPPIGMVRAVAIAAGTTDVLDDVVGVGSRRRPPTARTASPSICVRRARSAIAIRIAAATSGLRRIRDAMKRAVCSA
ncbi:hypothetical protein GCM10017653_34320 [Ancylobacter defluvii]|uniref:Uncharacterized protein n=1 Tax=Ancylobacter defluvii TaxID=1282440 RepID=A0A9W6NC85_9HYPH|nr:hypothetical protein GCM10017653_34320 [Ancylobacter defluvii]